jgi:hypothetical protein
MTSERVVNGMGEAYDIERFLTDCGVTGATLGAGEEVALEEQGFVVFPTVVDFDWLARLRTAFEAAAGHCQPDGHQTGTRHVQIPVGNYVAVDDVLTNPRLIAAVYHVLGCPFRLGQLHGRDPLPGFGQQGLHSDWFPRARSEPFRVVTAIWLLDHFTAKNGATRLVPGTHRLCTVVPKNLADPAGRHPDQVVIVAPAGSLLVFNGHLWHSGTRNESDHTRRVLQCQFVGRDEYRFASIDRQSIPEGLSPAIRYILGA